MSAVADALDRAREAGRGALVGYLPFGYPDRDTSVQAIIALANAGVDVIEIGVPYSDPVMDGPVIQEATGRALQAGFKVHDLFSGIVEIAASTHVPLLTMSYWNPIIQYGVDRYADDLARAGAAGVITPDITPESAGEWIAASERTGLDRVFLAAPTSTDRRLSTIVQASTGFVYTVSTMGVTGERQELDVNARSLVQRLRTQGATHCCVGIGISTPEQVRTTLGYADGAIVGSALVRALRDGGIPELTRCARDLVAATTREE